MKSVASVVLRFVSIGVPSWLVRFGTRRGVALFTWILGLRLAAVFAAAPPVATDHPSVVPDSLPVLTNISAVRHLSVAEAQRAYRVRVHGVVTYSDAPQPSLFFQDPTAGIWVELASDQPAIPQGQLIDLEAATAPGAFAPILTQGRAHLLGPGPDPPAKTVTLEEVLTGRYDAQWVEVKGTVRSVAFENGVLALLLASPVSTLTAYVAGVSTNAPAPPLVGAQVRVRGACGSEFNQRRQFVYAHLMVPSLERVVVTRPAVKDPFALPLQSIRELFRFQMQEDGDERVHVAGTLTLQLPGERLVLQDGADGISVESTQRDRLQLGDRVEVVGFPTGGGYAPHLDHALYRRLGPGRMPEPLDLAARQIPGNDFQREILEFRLVRISARLVDVLDTPAEQILWLESGSQSFKAVLHRQSLNPPGEVRRSDLGGLRRGSRLELTGVCVQLLDLQHIVRAFEIDLRSPTDVRVLEAASWWTARHTSTVLVSVTLVLLGALVWIQALRRQVRKQTAELRSSEARYRNLVDYSPEAIFVHDESGQVTFANPATAKLLGLATPEAVVGRTPMELVAPSSRAAVLQRIEQDFKSGSVPRFLEHRVLRSDGTERDVESIGMTFTHEGRRGIQVMLRDITERKQAEAALRETQERLELALIGAKMGVWEWTFRENRVVWSPECFKIMGVDHFDGTLASFTNRLHPADAARVLQTAEQALANHSDFTVEFRILRPDGQERWVANVGRGHYDAAGQPVRLIGTLQDITERREVEQALSESEERFRQIAETVDAIFWMASPDMKRFYYVSPVYERLWGRRVVDLFADPTQWSQALPAEDRERVFAELAKLGASQDGVSAEFRVARPDGTVRWVQGRAYALRDAAGQPTRFLGIVTDITERRRAEESIRLLGSAVEQSAEAVMITEAGLDPMDSKIVFINPSFTRMRGYTAEELLGQTPQVLQTTKRNPAFLDTLERTLKRGQVFHDEGIAYHKDGTELHLEWCITPLRGPDGTVTHFVSNQRDITVRKKAEAKARKLQQQLLETSRQAGMAEVATSILHNVGNVLNAVNLSSSLLLEKAQNSRVPNVVKAAALLEDNRDRLAGFLTEDPKGQHLPDYLKALAGRLAAEREEMLSELGALRRHVDHIKEIVALQQSYAKVVALVEPVTLPEVVEDALRINAEAMERHHVRVVREFAPTPPVLTERHKVLQILVNLIRNAKYALDESPTGDRQLTLRIEPLEPEGVRLTVADNGIGIAAENRSRIFELGFTTRKTGHGFGLHDGALAARELGGELTVRSDGPGRGATFTLLLPLRRGKVNP